jgi:hypothetical protein
MGCLFNWLAILCVELHIADTAKTVDTCNNFMVILSGILAAISNPYLVS